MEAVSPFLFCTTFLFERKWYLRTCNLRSRNIFRMQVQDVTENVEGLGAGEFLDLSKARKVPFSLAAARYSHTHRGHY